jgi:cytochrome c oxidase subunit 3
MSSDAHGAPSPAHAPAGQGIKQPFHLVDPSPWPLLGSLSAFLTVLGIVAAAHSGGFLLLILGLLSVLGVMFVWWRDVLKESATPGMHSAVVRLGLRYGMMMFIASEVMFFVGFFWSWFNFALFPENVANAGANAVWPPAGVHTFDPFHLPFLNTMILLLSGTTVTWAHHGLLEGNRKALVNGLALTVMLGLLFTTCQAIEYSDAPFKFSGGGV